MNNRTSIPNELLNPEHSYEDISVIIGENGSGKSTMLNELMKHHAKYNSKTLGIANSIHDKFDYSTPNTYLLRGRQGRKQVKITIKDAIQNIAKEKDVKRLSYVSQALKYVGFDPMIGIRIPKVKTTDFKEKIEKTLRERNDRVLHGKRLIPSPEGKEELFYLLERFSRDGEDKIIWIEMSDNLLSMLEKFSFTTLFLWEGLLRNSNIIDPIEVYLSKNDNTIDLLSASSGELSLITSIIYLATIINEETVILIDEPENSLHPKWQKEYVKNLFDLFHYFQPKIIIATHSPIIVNGAEIFVESSKIYKSTNFELTKQQNYSQNIEEIYFDFFNITTPENRFLSNILISKLNELAEKEINRDEFYVFLEKIKQSSYDPRQNELIRGIEQIIEKIN